MSTKDQILSAALHGEALLAAKRPELQPLIDHLREVAQSRDDIRTECVGVMAGSWFASPGGGCRSTEPALTQGIKRQPGNGSSESEKYIVFFDHTDIDQDHAGTICTSAYCRNRTVA
jgi:hypothetical protein